MHLNKTMDWILIQQHMILWNNTQFQLLFILVQIMTLPLLSQFVLKELNTWIILSGTLDVSVINSMSIHCSCKHSGCSCSGHKHNKDSCYWYQVMTWRSFSQEIKEKHESIWSEDQGCWIKEDTRWNYSPWPHQENDFNCGFPLSGKISPTVSSQVFRRWHFQSEASTRT